MSKAKSKRSKSRGNRGKTKPVPRAPSLKVGRPSKIDNPRLVEVLLDAIRAGNYYGPACAIAGVSYQAFREWMRRGEAAAEIKANGKRLPKGSKKYLDFHASIKGAELEAEGRIVSLWRTQIPGDWRAAEAFLKKRFPLRWGAMLDQIGAGDPEREAAEMPFTSITFNFPDGSSRTE